MNLVAALIMLGPVGSTSVSPQDRLVPVFGILAGLTGVATLIQVGLGRKTQMHRRTTVLLRTAVCVRISYLILELIWG